MKDLFPYLIFAFIRVVRILFRQIRRILWEIQALPYTYPLQHLSMQYALALLLATILAFLVGWPLFLWMLPHTLFALLGY